MICHSLSCNHQRCSKEVQPRVQAERPRRDRDFGVSCDSALLTEEVGDSVSIIILSRMSVEALTSTARIHKPQNPPLRAPKPRNSAQGNKVLVEMMAAVFVSRDQNAVICNAEASYKRDRKICMKE